MRLASTAIVLSIVLLGTGCIVHIGGVSSGSQHSWNRSAKRGSGISVTQDRQVPPFQAVHYACPGWADVHVGGDPSVSVTADDNLTGDVVTEVRNGVLVISMREGAHCDFRVGPNVRINVASLDLLQISGSGDASVDGLKADSFAASIRGSGDLKAQGSVGRLDVQIAGSGDADLSGVDSKDASVAIQGSGNVRLRAGESLTVAISGSGDVEYVGEPKHKHVSVSGSGEVRRGN